MRAPDDNKPAGGSSDAQRQLSRAELTDANAALAAELAELKAKMAADAAEMEARLAARPAVPVSEEAWTLLTKLRHDGREYEAGDIVPFDPVNPPKGCGGLEEGVHFTKSRVLRG